MTTLASLVTVVAAACAAFAAAGAAAAPPVVFWSTRGHTANTTAMLLGGGLATHGGPVATGVQVCTDSPGRGCAAAEVLDAHPASVKFVVPGFSGHAGAAPATPSALWARVCRGTSAHSPCSAWFALNAPDVWWLQGDLASTGASVATTTAAVATAGSRGRLKVVGRAIGFAGLQCASATPTVPSPGRAQLTLTPRTGNPILLLSAVASCFDAEFAVPASVPPGQYSVSISNGVTRSSIDHEERPLKLMVVAATPWPAKRFPVAVGESVAAAVAAAGAAGGGVVALAAGVHEMRGASLALPHDVTLRGAGVSAGAGAPSSTLRWSENTTTPLIVNTNGSAAAAERYALRDVTIVVAAQSIDYVIDIGGHGVEVSGVTVTHSVAGGVAGMASVVHTSGTGFSLTGCDMMHDQRSCTNPGYPRNCLLHFTAGTDAGRVAGNTFKMGCCAFCGYSASGVLLENNTFVDMPTGVQPDGNGFATFGGARVSERISFSRNDYRGSFDGHNIRDGSYPHEAFTSDGNGGAYAGPASRWTLDTVTTPKQADAGYVGGSLAVIAGTGQGQIRRVASVSGSSYTLGQPLAVGLSPSSIVVVSPYVGCVLMMGNTIRNSTTVKRPHAPPPARPITCWSLASIRLKPLFCHQCFCGSWPLIMSVCPDEGPDLWVGLRHDLRR
jgi:hypothetical protein